MYVMSTGGSMLVAALFVILNVGSEWYAFMDQTLAVAMHASCIVPL